MLLATELDRGILFCNIIIRSPVNNSTAGNVANFLLIVQSTNLLLRSAVDPWVALHWDTFPSDEEALRVFSVVFATSQVVADSVCKNLEMSSICLSLDCAFLCSSYRAKALLAAVCIIYIGDQGKQESNVYSSFSLANDINLP